MENKSRFKKTCFSYIRFSSKAQADGNSEARQNPIAARVAKEKGWTLDTSLNIADLGLSAYKKANLPSIHAILEGVKSGRIPQGSVMIIEAFDRLTRTDIDESLPLLTEILRSGLELYIDRISRHLTKASLKDPIELTMALFELKGSYEYSAKLGARLASSWADKKLDTINGTILTSRTPGWITIDPTLGKTTKAFKVDRERANIIKRIYREYLEGKGTRMIALGLNRDKVKNFGTGQATGKGWSGTPLKRFLTTVSVLGTYQPHKYISKSKSIPEGEPVEGYYPAIIDKATFYAVQRRMKERRTTRGARKHLFNLFSGLIKCAHCGSTMVLKTGSVTNLGKKAPWITLVCSKAHRGMGCEYRTMKYAPLEKGLLTTLWIRLLVASNHQTNPGKELEDLQGELEDVQAKQARIQKRIADTGDVPNEVMGALRDLRAKAANLKEKLALAPLQSAGSPVANWTPIPNDITNRLKVQGMLSDIVEEITLDAKGRKASISIRGGGKAIKASWQDDNKTGFTLMGESQEYLDDVIIWQSPRNVKIGVVTISDSDRQPAGRVLNREQSIEEHKGKETVLAMV